MGESFFSSDDPGQVFVTDAPIPSLYEAGPIPIVWPGKLNPRTDFDPIEFQRLIWQLGLPALWEMWSPCVCGHEQSARQDCPVCHGSGDDFHSPQEILAVCSGVRRDWEPQERPQMMEVGVVNFGVRGEHVPAPGDRITMLTAHINLTLMATRDAPMAAPHVSPIERMRYPVFPQVIRIRNEAGDVITDKSYGVIHARACGADGKPKTDSHGHPAVMVEGVDFVVTDAGWIDWTLGDHLGTTPAKGDQFSVYYKTRPVYRVMSYPAAFRDTMTLLKRETAAVEPLPVEFLGKLAWLPNPVGA